MESNVLQLHSWIEKLASRRPFQREREREKLASRQMYICFFLTRIAQTAEMAFLHPSVFGICVPK